MVCYKVALQSLNSHILFYTDQVVCERDMYVIFNEKCPAKQPRLNEWTEILKKAHTKVHDVTAQKTVTEF